MARKTESNEEVWERRRGVFEDFLAGTPTNVLAAKYKIHREQVRDDIAATTAWLKDYDGLERISATRTRVLAQLWREVEIATDHEFAAMEGVPAQDVDKNGDIIEYKLVDIRGAAAYQGNRLKALAGIERLMGLAKAAPTAEDEKAASSWKALIQKAQAKKEAEKAAAGDGSSVQ